MQFHQKALQNLEQSFALEWLETNGKGGYSSSNLIECNTRKYHGLLVSSLPKLQNKYVLLSKLETSVYIDGEEYELSTNKYPGTLFPHGYKYYKDFKHDTFPMWTYDINGVTLQKSIMMVRDEDTVLLRFELIDGCSKLNLNLKPFLAFRASHDLTEVNDDFDPSMTSEGNYYSVKPYDLLPEIHFTADDNLDFQFKPVWFENFEYYKEREKNNPYHEDLHSPGLFSLELNKGKALYFKVSLDKTDKSLESIWQQESDQRNKKAKLYKDDQPLSANLKMQADHFLVKNYLGQQVITAGYPWYVSWGRDAMISLPGLTILRGLKEEALSVLTNYTKHEQNGMLPNYVNIIGGENSYNSVDASLWFFWACKQYLTHTNDMKSMMKDLVPCMRKVIQSFIANEVPVAQLNENGLISSGNSGTHLTWMDATAWGRPATPRYGYAVEVNALWIHALGFYLETIKEDPTGEIRKCLDKAKKSFIELFWLKEGYLADLVNEQVDTAFRPNQIFAVSLDYMPLSENQKQSILDKVKEKLLTPYGLRTLSQDHPQYRGEYTGNINERDYCYHQGTIWPWLLAPYAEACFKNSKDKSKLAKELQEYIKPLIAKHTEEVGLKQISEIFDGDAPHTPRGCIAQAWSVGEVIRALHLIQNNL
ncbi:MAG: glycogen debranching enzyme N-terminal domain-containing protein [Planctomycetes bacterium]|nr:glycogen debranching enzyme N-terminal domain-containing protein [Planctomycetota bacterium]